MTDNRPTYRIVKVSDPRSRGACYWFELEGMKADGTRWYVGTYDTREEAREIRRQLEEHDARGANDNPPAAN